MVMLQLRNGLRRCARYASTTADAHAGQGRKPMINFNSRSRGHGLEAGKAHPCAPPEIAKDFASFGSPDRQPRASAAGNQNEGLKSPNPTSQPTSGSSPSPKPSQSSSPPPPKQSPSKGLPPADFEEFFEMPKRYWTPIAMEEAEIEAVMTGGATSVLKHV